MRLFAALIAVFLLLPASVPAAGNTAYFSAMPDLPLPPGMSENTDDTVRFDQPEARVIALRAHGKIQISDIKQFYIQTLPALGWKPTGGNRFVREDEVLELDAVSRSDGMTALRILVNPR